MMGWSIRSSGATFLGNLRSWIRVTILATTITSVFLHTGISVAAVYQYAVQEGGRTVYLWVPPPCSTVRGLIVSFRNLSEPLWLEDPVIRGAATDKCLGVVWIGSGKNSALDANMGPSAGAAFLAMQRDLAKVSGFHDIEDAPILPMGHSAQGQFAWKFAEWAPQRTIAAIPVKTVPLPRSLDLKGVPMLYAVGETTEWPQFRDGRPGDRDFFWPVVRDSAKAIRTRDLRSRLGVVTDPGGGHFDWSPALAQVVALFIRKACDLRLPQHSTHREAPPAALRPLPLESGWLADARGLKPDRFPASPYAKYRGPRNEAYWFFDREMAAAVSRITGSHIALDHQMLSFEQDGIALPVASRGFAALKFKPEPGGITFSLHPVFLSSIPDELIGAGTPLGHSPGPIRLSAITGPVQQIAPYQFELAFSREAIGGEAWIEEEQDGDQNYRKAVQSARLSIPQRLTQGTPQVITFEQIPDQNANVREISLHATSSSGLPVRFFVLSGPALVVKDKLRFVEIPRRGSDSITISVVAYQWGRFANAGQSAIQTATPVTVRFNLRSD